MSEFWKFLSHGEFLKHEKVWTNVTFSKKKHKEGEEMD